MSADDKETKKARPSWRLHAALVDGKRVVMIGPRLSAIGPLAASSPQVRAVLNILESTAAGILSYAILSGAAVAFAKIDEFAGGIGDVFPARIVRTLIVDGGLWVSVAWLGVALLSTAKLVIQTTWRLLVDWAKQGGGRDGK